MTECWETASFNNNTCAWEVSGAQPLQPNTACYESATFNNNICAWEISGTQPQQPITECYETASFNNNSCAWEVTGTMPPEPTGLECYQSTLFNAVICAWEITGTQPSQPNTACYETATFNSSTCNWEVTGIQPQEPTDLECYQSANFDNLSCEWVVTGSPVQIEIMSIDQAVYAPWTTHFYVQSNQSVNAYEWYVDDNLEGNASTLDYTFASAGEYEVVVSTTANNECTATDTLRIRLEQLNSTLMVPNCFTPNADSINDFFTVKSEHLAKFEMLIFNRWGKLIFETNSVYPGWNGGSDNDYYYPDGTYMYIIRAAGFDGLTYDVSGSLTLLR